MKPPDLDDLLARELARAAKPSPAPPDLVGNLSRRRIQRRRWRRGGTAGLAVLVLVGTAVGFLGLQQAFRVAPPSPGPATRSDTPSPTRPAGLTGTWVVVDYWNGKRLVPVIPGADGREITLEISASKDRFGGYWGCNSHGGRFLTKGDQIEFRRIIGTQIACDPQIMEQEADIFRALRDTSWYVPYPHGERLTLRGPTDLWLMTLRRADTVVGKDVGTGFRICRVERLGNVHFGDARGAAWLGLRVSKGACSRRYEGDWIVAVDTDWNHRADLWAPVSCRGGCDPSLVGSTDLNADGWDELFIRQWPATTPSYYVYTVVPLFDRDRLELAVAAPPGHRKAGVVPGHPPLIASGADEGFAGAVGCRGWPSDPVLVVNWSDHPVEGAVEKQLHVTWLSLDDEGRFQLVRRSDSTVPLDAPLPQPRSCGVDLSGF